jgi:hypothetical protein
MSKNTHKSLADLIGSSSSGFGKLADVARQKASLSDFLRSSLDKELAGGFVHCNIRDDGTLVVFASSSAWAARLRFATQQFTDLCRKQGLQVQSVKVRVSS